jgi:hypothetical protein
MRATQVEQFIMTNAALRHESTPGTERCAERNRLNRKEKIAERARQMAAKTVRFRKSAVRKWAGYVKPEFSDDRPAILVPNLPKNCQFAGQAGGSHEFSIG